METSRANLLEATLVPGQDALMKSILSNVTALDSSASLMGVLNAIRATGWGAGGASSISSGIEALLPATTRTEFDVAISRNESPHSGTSRIGSGDAFDDPSLFRQPAIFGPVASHNFGHKAEIANGHSHDNDEHSHDPVVDPLTGITEAAPVGASATELFTWNTAAPSPLERFEAQGAAANGKLYVFGGFFNSSIDVTTRSDVYDPASDTWTQVADMPEALTHSAVVVDGQSIYLTGGYVGDHPGPSTDHIWRYDTITNLWSGALSLPAPRGAGAAVLLGRDLHFFGGATRTAGQLNEVDQGDHYVLSLDGGTNWSNLAPLTNPRNHLAGVGLGGKIYAIGGQHERNEVDGNQNQVDVYNPATNTWKRVANLPVPRGHISSSTFVTDGRIDVIGGTLNGNKPSADVTTYDPQANVWVKLPSLPAGRKTPVADVIGDQIDVTTGNAKGGAVPTNTTWTGVLTNKWESSTAMPAAVGEVAGGIIGNKLYLVGEGSPVTFAYNLSTGKWGSTSALSQRPLVGNHHAAEVFNKKLYLFGGLEGSSEGKVQIYNPATNAWSLGANMPFAGGSSSSAVIGKQIYVAGGIVGSSTTNQTAKYNPATNTWRSLAPMQQGRNHAASTTDGANLYVFGGRGPGSGDSNTVANGFDTVQIYNPATNAWVSSLDTGSTLAPLPQARGGMGKAVYFNGEFYVMGGETQDGVGVTDQNVYDRVDIYNPLTNTWRLGTPMPTARHGIFPLLLAGRINVAGGGIQAGLSNSSLLETYNPGPNPLATLP